jgi:dihydrofolate reductase
MRISLIVAMTRARVIGRNNTMPWHLPADLKRFRAITMGRPIIMGRKTFESLPRVLPGRPHIVISRDPNYEAPDAEVVASLDAALEVANDAEEVFVIGGAEIYRQALPRADRIYLTLVDAEIEGDVYFPEFDLSDWREIEQGERAADTQNSYRLTFSILERR